MSAGYNDWGSDNQKNLAWSDVNGNMYHEVWGGAGQPNRYSQGSGVPAGSTPLAEGWYWQAGNTIYRNDGSVAATNVNKVDALFNNWGTENQKNLAWSDADGNMYQEVWDSASRPTRYAQGNGVPAGSTPYAAGYYWLSGDTLYRTDGSIMDASVNELSVVKNNWGSANQEIVGWTKKARC